LVDDMAKSKQVIVLVGVKDALLKFTPNTYTHIALVNLYDYSF